MLVSVVEAGSVPYSDFQPLPLKFQQLELLLGLDRWNRSSSFWAPVVQRAQPEQTTITKLKDELADHGSLNKRHIWVSGVCQTFKPEWRLSGKPIEHFVDEFNIKQSAVKPAAVRSQQLLRFTEAGVRVLVWTQSDFWAVHGLNVKSVVQPHSPYCAQLIWKHDAVVIRLASFTLYNTNWSKSAFKLKPYTVIMRTSCITVSYQTNLVDLLGQFLPFTRYDCKEPTARGCRFESNPDGCIQPLW